MVVFVHRELSCNSRESYLVRYATKSKMNQHTLTSELLQLMSRVEALPESTTVEQFCAALNMEHWPGGWDSVESGTGFNVYTWWLDDGFNLHAYFCEGVAVTNRFGPAGISKNGGLIWHWSPNQDDLTTMRFTCINDNAKENHRS